ncbi:uncharacterized protein MELLADRAFT_114416 [Melampsora larici-populina 98AG31]|uniref:Secreted protein n=1 Tax=Melampsora larici-populina (strain 98AG31 / pathotype 3-4-7) TaxID=747676 RepID=F4SDD4_MELLP|nr:uncharacterized protein MELLADRAFT_114416 [Melampsora larici-populina 98AG31]EGF97342.1 hypothetical protein MELLADRAFT_114416 [Melampsora larici-populina 98AG31]
MIFGYLAILQIYMYHCSSAVIAGPFEAPSNPLHLDNDLGHFGVEDVEGMNTQNPTNHRHIQDLRPHVLKISESSVGGKSDKQQYDTVYEDINKMEKKKYNPTPIDWQTSKKRQGIYQNNCSTSGPGSGSSSSTQTDSKIQEITLFGNIIQAESNYMLDIRKFSTHRMNRLCVYLSRYLVKQFTSTVKERVHKSLSWQGILKAYQQFKDPIFAPFVYFIMLRGLTKDLWYRVQILSSFILAEFYKLESKDGDLIEPQKIYQFMLWHTEMIYCLTNPKLLEHIKEKETISSKDSKEEMHRGTSPLSKILSALASEMRFWRLCEKPTRASEWAALYLKNYWRKDCSSRYPGLPESNTPPISNAEDWERISMIIMNSHTLSKQSEFNLLLDELTYNEPIMGPNSLFFSINVSEDDIDFNQDMKEITTQLDMLKLRQDLQDIQESNIYQGLGVWMDLHAKGDLRFSDPFCVTAIYNFLESRSPGIDLNVFWKNMQAHEKRRKYYCAKSLRNYRSSKKQNPYMDKKSKPA